MQQCFCFVWWYMSGSLLSLARFSCKDDCHCCCYSYWSYRVQRPPNAPLRRDCYLLQHPGGEAAHTHTHSHTLVSASCPVQQSCCLPPSSSPQPAGNKWMKCTLNTFVPFKLLCIKIITNCYCFFFPVFIYLGKVCWACILLFSDALLYISAIRDIHRELASVKSSQAGDLSDNNKHVGNVNLIWGNDQTWLLGGFRSFFEIHIVLSMTLSLMFRRLWFLGTGSSKCSRESFNQIKRNPGAQRWAFIFIDFYSTTGKKSLNFFPKNLQKLVLLAYKFAFCVFIYCGNMCGKSSKNIYFKLSYRTKIKGSQRKVWLF